MPKISRTCPECGARFTTANARVQFCLPAHSKAYSNRQLKRGQAIVSLAMAWRAGKDIARPDKSPNPKPEARALRQAAKEAYAHLCRELDLLIAEDRDADRLHPTRLYRRRLVAGLLDR